MAVVAIATGTIYDQNDAPSGELSLDRCALPADSAGMVSDFSTAVSTFTVRVGNIDDSAKWAISVVKSTGLLGSLAGRTFTVTGLSVDSGYVDFTATRPGFASITKRFHVGKLKQGITGATGSSVWYAYHDNPPSSAPASPTGDGSTVGWHALLTAASIWISSKQTVNRADAGTWGTPAVISAISLAPTYAPKYLGAGRLSALATPAFRKDTIDANGTITTGANVTPNAGDWMYNYDTSVVATLSVFRWSSTAWETTTVTFELWIAATEDILRYIKGAADATARAARTPAAWTLLDSLIGNEAFFDKFAARIIRSANYQAGVSGMSIDLNAAQMQAENQAWRLLGNGHAIFRDIEIYGADYEEVDCGDYTTQIPDWPFGSGEELDCGDYVVSSWAPERMFDCGLFMGGF